MNTEFVGLCSLPLITSEMNLCEPWTTSGLQPLGSFTNNSKHELFGRESGEKFIFTKNFDGDQRREKRQRQLLEKWGQVSFLSLVPRGVTPLGKSIFTITLPMADHGDNVHVTTGSSGPPWLGLWLGLLLVRGYYIHCIIRIHISTPSATECHRLHTNMERLYRSYP